MSALINRHLPLIETSAAHKIAARGYQAIGRGYSSAVPGAGPARNARESMAIARVHSSALRAHFAAGAAWRQSEAAKLDAAIAANLKELGYGG
ncbi:MAG TPA: hypothetical protein VLH79_08530 [Chthonomonadales bacterium]|nr:hypothetical protein [Chthonomonadales bacterium]